MAVSDKERHILQIEFIAILPRSPILFDLLLELMTSRHV
jgi:hypothetical protein